MKLILPSLFFTIIFYSCLNVERVDVSNIKDELALSKPMVISDGEILSVAHVIGDSLTKTLTILEDTSFTIGYNQIHVISESNQMLEDVDIKTFFDAYKYTFEEGNNVKSNVNKKDKNIVQYHSAFLTEQKEIKMVLVNVSIKDITLKIAAERKK